MYKFVFLINPISGDGQGKTIYEYLPEIMKSMDFSEEEWRREFTLRDGFENQIQKALSEAETLIAVGGDGTVSSVFTEMEKHERRSEVKIGLIPLGTGNDLARVLGLYSPFVERGLLFLVRRLLLADALDFDIWMVNGKIAFANYLSAGIDARIAHDFNGDRANGILQSHSVIANKIHYVKKFFSNRKYFLKAGKLSIFNESLQKEIALNGCRTVIVGNIPSFASGSNPFFRSDMGDGLVEIVCVPNLFSFLLALGVGNFPGIGFLYKKYFLKSYKASSFEIEILPDEFLQIDGEDWTGKFGEKIRGTYGFKVQMLSLRA